MIGSPARFEENTRVKSIKQTAYLAAVCAALVACGAKESQSGKPGGSTQSSSVMAIKRKLAEIAGQANQAAPANVDPDTRLDGAKAGSGLRLTTTYTLVNAEANGVNNTTFESKLASVVKQGSCENTELRPLIDQGVVVVLEYRGNDGGRIGTVNINRDTCVALKSGAAPK
jgi:hypothetical protein